MIWDRRDTMAQISARVLHTHDSFDRMDWKSSNKMEVERGESPLIYRSTDVWSEFFDSETRRPVKPKRVDMASFVWKRLRVQYLGSEMKEGVPDARVQNIVDIGSRQTNQYIGSPVWKNVNYRQL